MTRSSHSAARVSSRVGSHLIVPTYYCFKPLWPGMSEPGSRCVFLHLRVAGFCKCDRLDTRPKPQFKKTLGSNFTLNPASWMDPVFSPMSLCSTRSPSTLVIVLYQPLTSSCLLFLWLVIALPSASHGSSHKVLRPECGKPNVTVMLPAAE